VPDSRPPRVPGQPRPPRVTLTTVADDAGVSRATVSLVVRDSPLVADATRAQVLESIAKLGYVYNRAAAGMRSNKTGTLGLIVSSIANPFFGELVAGVESRLSELGHTLLFTQHSDSVAAQRRQIEVMLEHRVDGVLVVPALATPVDHLERFRDAGMPIALVTRRIDGLHVPYVGSDNVSGARKAGEHLLEHGSQSIAFVGGLADSSPYREREEGLLSAIAMSRKQVELNSYPSAPTRDAGYEAVVKLLKRRGPKPDSILAYNDNLAAGVMAAIVDAGLNIGTDVRVVGYDDISSSKYSIPPLTTVSTRPSLIGSLATEALFDYIENQAADRDVLVPNSLAVRTSCGCTQDDGGQA